MIVQSTKTLTMGSGAATSGTIPIGGYTGGLIQMPDTFSGTALTFNVSADGTNYRPLYDVSGPVVLAASVAGSRVYTIPSSVFGAHSMALTAGTIQAADRAFTVRLKA